VRRAFTFAVVVLATLACESPESPPDSGTPKRDAGTDKLVPPCLEAKPSTIDFGEVEHPVNAFQRVELFNNSSLPVLVHALPRSSPFFISPLDGADLPLPAGGHRTVEVQFVNNDALLHNGAIELTAGDQCDATISVRALGSGTVSMEPTPLEFGFLAPGQSKTLEVRIVNTRRTAVPVISLELQESSSLGNAFTANLPSLPFELPPMSSTSIMVTATPPTDLTFDAQLVVATMFGIARADLRAIGGGPIAQVVPSTIDIPLATFEPTLRGAPSFVERRVLLRNLSTVGRSLFSRLQLVQPIFLTEQADGGPDDEVMAQIPAELLFGFGIDLGQEMEIFLHVTPNALGRRSYRARLITNDPLQAEQVINLSVNVVSLGRCTMRVEPERDLQLAPSPDGRSRGTISFINEGPNRCVVDDPGFTLMSSPEFSIVDAASQLVVEPGTTRTLTIEGPRSAMNVDGTFGFHVLNPDSEREFIVLHVPP
jgi:hypothetical protein